MEIVHDGKRYAIDDQEAACLIVAAYEEGARYDEPMSAWIKRMGLEPK